jgi:hypothetical protein
LSTNLANYYTVANIGARIFLAVSQNYLLVIKRAKNGPKLPLKQCPPSTGSHFDPLHHHFLENMLMVILIPYFIRQLFIST